MIGYNNIKFSINEIIDSISLVKCFYYGYGRNAWYSTWSSFYCPSNIYTTFKETRDAIEDERTQGSVFKITETIGLLIKTKDNTYIAIDYTYTENPIRIDLFENFFVNLSNEEKLHSKISIFEFNNIFSSSIERSSIYSLNMTNIDFEHIKDNRLFQYTSKSLGVDYYLDYSNKKELEIDFFSAKKIANEYNKRNNTIDYYNNNYENFVESTQSMQMTEAWIKFTSKLPASSLILDLGCGSGRDTKYFLDHGYLVEATDGSEELCKAASEFTGIEVKNQLFTELSEVEKYDGVWACSSILHACSDDLVIIFKKIWTALKENGIFYTSFKYGDFEGERYGRYFTDFTEDSFAALINKTANFEIIDTWITDDFRLGQDKEKWLNVFLKKI